VTEQTIKFHLSNVYPEARRLEPDRGEALGADAGTAPGVGTAYRSRELPGWGSLLTLCGAIQQVGYSVWNQGGRNDQ